MLSFFCCFFAKKFVNCTAERVLAVQRQNKLIKNVKLLLNYFIKEGSSDPKMLKYKYKVVPLRRIIDE